MTAYQHKLAQDAEINSAPFKFKPFQLAHALDPKSLETLTAFGGTNSVICGLDSVEARRWMNATLVNMVDPENPESLKPMIDGGTEGFKGQARVILPTFTSCYECSLDMLNKQTAFPICTIANTPRLPEHCIEWASVLEWPKVHGGKEMNHIFNIL